LRKGQVFKTGGVIPACSWKVVFFVEKWKDIKGFEGIYQISKEWRGAVGY